jgi:protein O-mannosyl-transferase
VLLAYANVYHNDFVFDDLLLITDNKFLTSWHYIGTLIVTHTEQGFGKRDPFYRPLQLLLYLFVYQTAGPSTIAFHVLNVTLHALNPCLLYTLGVRLGFQRIGAFLAALLWALHPVHTTPVTCMSGTADLLYSAFLLAGTLVLASDFSRRNILAACLLFVLALLSKEAAVVFPVLVMGLLFYQSENRWSPKTYLKTWPFWLLVVLYFLARETVLNFNGFLEYYKSGVTAKMAIWDRFCTFLATLPVYLRLLVWPTGLHIERSFPIFTTLWTPQVMGGLGILAVLIIGIVWKPWRRATPLAWGVLWAGALFIPVSGILVPSDASISENWLYLPTAGFALGLGESLARLSQHVRIPKFRFALGGLAALITCLFGVMTFEQNKVWRDGVTLYTHIFACGEESARPRNNLGNLYLSKRQFSQAIDQYRRALALDDNYADAHYDLGLALLHDAQDRYILKLTAFPPDLSSPEFAEGINNILRAIELNPDDYKAYDTLAIFYAAIEDHDKESEYRTKAAAIRKKLGIE